MNVLVIGHSPCGLSAARTRIEAAMEFEEHRKVVMSMGDHAVNGAIAGEQLRKVLIGLSATPYRIEEESEKKPKKPVFFQRDIVPRKKRRFGK